MAPPTPIAIYGRDGKVAEGIREALLPEVDVVHTCVTLASAESELPALCAGDLSVAPASGYGSNVGVPTEERKSPRAIFFGAAITEDEVERIRQSVTERKGGDEIEFVRITWDEVRAAGGSGPNPEVLARIYREKVAGLGL